jgi:integrase
LTRRHPHSWLRAPAQLELLGRAPPDTTRADADALHQVDAGGAGRALARLDEGGARTVDGPPYTVHCQPLAELAEVLAGRLASAAAAQTPAACYLRQLSDGASRRTMAEALDQVARLASGGLCDRETFPWGRLRYAHAHAIREALVARYEPRTVNKMLAAFRSVLREAFQLGHFGTDGADEYLKSRSIKNVKRPTRPQGRMVPPDEYHALLHRCERDPSPVGRRNAALLAVLYLGGLRISEAASLALDDYDPATGRLDVIHGKGLKDRTVFLPRSGRQLVSAWLAARGLEPGALLCALRRNGTPTLRRVDRRRLWRIFLHLRQLAGLPAAVPHDFRRTYITEVARRSGVEVAQRLAGHARLDQTATYILLDEERLRDACEARDVPPAPRR